MKPARLRRGELLAAIAAAGLLVLMLLARWAGPGGGASDGWHAMPVLRWLLAVAIGSGLALAIAQAACRAPALPAALSVISTVLGAVATVALAVRLPTAAAAPDLGDWLGLAAAAGITAGAFLSLRDEQGWVPGPDRPIETVGLDRPS